MDAKKKGSLKKFINKYPKLKKIIAPIYRAIMKFLTNTFSLFYCNLFSYYFHIQLKKLPKEFQLFLMYRLDFGHFLELLDYVRYWQMTRGPTAILIISPWSAQVRALARYICPKTKFISINNSFINNKQFIPWVYADFIKKVIGRILMTRLNSLILYETPIYPDKSSYNFAIDPNINEYKLKVSNKFLQAYIEGNETYHYRYSTVKDFFSLYFQSSENHFFIPSFHLKSIRSSLYKKLNIYENYVIIHQNLNDYNNKYRNSRTIKNPTQYDCLIDFLIEKKFNVVIQGRKEQFEFKKRKGLINYALSPFASAENDLAIFSGAEFAVMNKTGASYFATICDIPILTLDFTEWACVHPHTKSRFYPKKIIDKINDKEFNWKEILAHPCFFNIASFNFSNVDLEYIDMSEEEIIKSITEFLFLVQQGNKWQKYTRSQKEFIDQLTPLHMDMYHAKGIPCDSYLNKNQKIISEDNLSAKYF